MLLSIVIPCYNEEDVLDLSLTQLFQDLDTFAIDDYEIICVDDGSRDKTLEILQRRAIENPRLKIVSLAANRGQQIAFYAGMCYSSGDAVVLMDADLQDPPSLIPDMIERWKEGYHVAYGKRLYRQGESFLKKITATLFYRILNRIADQVDIPKDVGEFRLMDKRVVQCIINMPEHHRFNRALVSWLGFRQCEVTFERPERLAGVSKFGWKDMFQLAKDGAFSFSYYPIRVIQSVGIFSLFIAFGLFCYSIFSRFLNYSEPGWASLMSVIAFFSGLILFFMGILGEYIVRIHTESLKRPIFIAATTHNLENKSLPEHLQAYHTNFE